MPLKANALYSRLLRDLRPHLSMRELGAFRKIGPDYFSSNKCSTKKVFALALANSFFKKLEPDQSDTADSAALLSFLERDSECSKWTLNVETDRVHLLLGEMKKCLYYFFHPNFGRDLLINSDYDVFLRGRTGPGVSVGSSGQHIFNKLFSGNLTSSNHGLYHLYRSYIKTFPDWVSAEMHRSSLYGECNIVSNSSLGFVPKERSKSRVICSEKSLDMFFQLGLASILQDRLKSYWGIDLSDQPDKNRELARLGSLADLGFDGLNYCTVDLKNASDMPLNMCRIVYPDHILRYLLRYRSGSTFIRGLGSRQLDILSSMGNGYTFPMQTILFASIILASYRLNNITPEFPFGTNLGNFGVFGDDLVFNANCVDDVYSLLSTLGFTVNKSKSFSKGAFRESCGSDFYKGINVRGVYIKTLTTPQSRYSAINALVEWSARSGIPLQRTVSYLVRSVNFVPIPRWENPDGGIRLPFSLSNVPYSIRHKMRRGWDVVKYQVYRPMHYGWSIGDCGFKGPRHLLERLSYNPHGLWLTFLHGSLEGGRANVRPTNVRYRLQNVLTPCWDSDPSCLDRIVNRSHPYSIRMSTWERWNTASYLNLDRT